MSRGRDDDAGGAHPDRPDALGSDADALVRHDNGTGAIDRDGPPDVEHVEVRRARPPASSVFGETPIAGPRLPEPDPAEPDEPAAMDDLAAWVRHAALVAALRTGAQACVVGVFMGIVLGFFLSGMMAGVGLLLGLALSIGAFPVAILAGFATYRQTLESERQRQGLCANCGYDLRGLNTARCPECGAKLHPPRGWLREPERPGEEEEAG